MPSLISDPELRDLGPADYACQLGAGRAKSDLAKRALIELLRRGEPEQADQRFERVVRPADRGRPEAKRGSALGRTGAVPGARRIDRSAGVMERPVTC